MRLDLVCDGVSGTALSTARAFLTVPAPAPRPCPPPPPPRNPTPQGLTKLARVKYSKALKVSGRGAVDLEGEEERAAAGALKASCLLNLARCAEREQEWGEALSWCNKAIRCGWVGGWVRWCVWVGEGRRRARGGSDEWQALSSLHLSTPLNPPYPLTMLCCSEDEAYAKAYFRRAVVAAGLGDLAAAAADLATCAALDASSAEECERELRRMERRAAQQEAQQRAGLKGFLDR